MADIEEIHVGDVDSRFLITIQDRSDVQDLSTANTLQITFHKPDGTNFTVNGSLYTDGTDGILYYDTTSASILDKEGFWKLQCIIGFPSGGNFHTNIGKFTVYPNL